MVATRLRRMFGRRKLLLLAGLGAGAGLGGRQLAQAANGDAVVAGQQVTATALTAVQSTVTGNPAVRASNAVASGYDAKADGVQGYADGANNAGLFGRNNALNGVGVAGAAPSGTGAYGESLSGTGVGGKSTSGTAVYAEATAAGHGVIGVSQSGFGAYGVSTSSYGLLGANFNGNTYAAYFIGHSGTPADNNGPGVYVKGTLFVTGTKAAAVRTSRGLTALYAIEAPESLFEDVGRASLAAGRARVDLDPLFAETIVTTDFEAFVTPLGDCKGLFVAARDARGFEVREVQGGTSAVAFSWRVAAKRKDAPAGHRLANAAAPTIPAVPTPTPEPGPTPTIGPSPTP